MDMNGEIVFSAMFIWPGPGWKIGVTWSRKRSFEVAAIELGNLLTKLTFWLSRSDMRDLPNMSLKYFSIHIPLDDFTTIWMILRDIDEEIKIAYQIFSTTWLCRWFGFDSAVALSTGKIPVKSANKNTDLQISRLKYIVSKWVLCHKLPWCYRNILLLNIFHHGARWNLWSTWRCRSRFPEILLRLRFCGGEREIPGSRYMGEDGVIYFLSLNKKRLHL